MDPDPTMPTPVQPVLEYAQGEARGSGRGPVPMVARVFGIAGGVVAPVVCFVSSFFKMPIRATWQSGEFHDYALLMLSGWNVWPFFPILAYSIVCMILVCAVPRRRVVGRRWVGLGLVAGVVLSVQFCAIILAGLNPSFSEPAESLLGILVYTGAPLGAAVGLHVIFRVLPARWVWAGIAVILMAGWMVSKILNPELRSKDVLEVAYIATLIMGPVWCLEAYAALAILWRRLRRAEREAMVRDGGGGGDLGLVVLVPAWGTAYAASWAVAVAQAIRAYHALPTTRPTSCYVASAAARGHRRFVRARDIGGGVMVNDQLRRLKCAEIALATVAPRAHRAVRWVYDRVGPVMARGLVRPVLADLAYVTLKPVEGVCVWVMRRWVVDFDALAAGVYCDQPAMARVSPFAEGPHPGPLPEYRARG